MLLHKIRTIVSRQLFTACWSNGTAIMSPMLVTSSYTVPQIPVRGVRRYQKHPCAIIPLGAPREHKRENQPHHVPRQICTASHKAIRRSSQSPHRRYAVQRTAFGFDAAHPERSVLNIGINPRIRCCPIKGWKLHKFKCPY